MDIVKKHHVLQYIKPFLPPEPIIVEAGAFDGTQANKMVAVWPDCIIYAFEPVPEIFELLKKNTAHLLKVHTYQIALSDMVGTAEFNLAEKPHKAGNPCQAGSLLKPKERTAWSPIEYNRTIQVPTITLDLWAEQNAITQIDLLWLDVQGYALNILKASPNILKTIKVIHVEVEFVEAYQGQYLSHEVVVWLQHQGFTPVAQDFSNTTDWFFGDIIFVRR